MQSFRFRLERVRRVRHLEEKLAQRGLAVARDQERREQAALATEERERDRELELLYTRLRGWLDLGAVTSQRQSWQYRRRAAERQADVLSGARARVEERRCGLVAASRRRRLLDRLRERRLSEYERESERVLQRGLDETGVDVYRRGLALTRKEVTECN